MDLYQIITTILTLVLGGLGLYFKYNKKLNTNVTDFINEAEETYKSWTKAGGLKFTTVVDKLHMLIPAPLRAIFTEKMIGELVQRVFNAMEEYAKKQLDKIVDNDSK